MKKTILFLVSLLLAQLPIIGFAQNKPSNAGYPGTGPTGTATYPLNYNQGTVPMPNGYNYTRVYAPLTPMTSVPDFDNTKTLPVIVNTTYKGGWNERLMDISRTNIGYDLVKVYDYRYSDTTIEYLPYADTFHSKFQNTAFTQQKNYYLSKYPLEGAHAYSKSINNNSGGTPTSLNYMSGRMMVGEKKRDCYEKISQ